MHAIRANDPLQVPMWSALHLPPPSPPPPSLRPAVLHRPDCLCSSAPAPLSLCVSASEIIGLQTCHRVHSISKFWGACNESRALLDVCLRVDKDVRRKANMDKSQWRERSEELRQRTEEKLAAKQASHTA